MSLFGCFEGKRTLETEPREESNAESSNVGGSVTASESESKTESEGEKSVGLDITGRYDLVSIC